MTTKKQKFIEMAEKRQQFLAEEKERGLQAQRKDREARARQAERTQANIDQMNKKAKQDKAITAIHDIVDSANKE